MGPYIVNQKILKVLGLTQISKIRVQLNYGHNYLDFFLWSIITLLLLPSWFSSFGQRACTDLLIYQLPLFFQVLLLSINNESWQTKLKDSSGYCDVLEDLSYAKSDTDSCNEACGDESDEEVSLEELLQDGKTKEKVEVLAAMVGLETTDPATVLNEVVRVLKVLNKINQYQLSA
ncbi:uncharacterized protein LOC124829250 [Vigna umbellata]|uniref:uncharacterized protein LOC124829250 n=1 Tax=Vigna umbellata TaxID=87088 RepID=UPI001F5F08EB|nr:uncharacterized protein LOC124829250 [Vigna umbellata]